MDEHEARLFLFRKYLDTSDEVFLHAAEKLRRIPDKPITGVEILVRAVGKPSVGRPSLDKEDSKLLLEMGKLIALRRCQNPWRAANRVAKRRPGHSKLATAKRLHRKFNQKPGHYLGLARFLIRLEHPFSISLVSGFPRLFPEIDVAGSRFSSFSSRLIPMDRMNKNILRISQAMQAPTDPFDRLLRNLELPDINERLSIALPSFRIEA